MNLKCPNWRNLHYWKNMLPWPWKNWCMKLSSKMMKKSINKNGLKTTGSKWFKKNKAMKKMMALLNKASRTQRRKKWKKKTQKKKHNKVTNRKINKSLKANKHLKISKRKFKCFKPYTSLWGLNQNLWTSNLFLT